MSSKGACNVPYALKHIGGIPLAALLCATVPVLAATPECSERMSLAKLIANPDETEKREVQDRIYALSAKRKLSGVK